MALSDNGTCVARLRACARATVLQSNDIIKAELRTHALLLSKFDDPETRIDGPACLFRRSVAGPKRNQGWSELLVGQTTWRKAAHKYPRP